MEIWTNITSEVMCSNEWDDLHVGQTGLPLSIQMDYPVENNQP